MEHQKDDHVFLELFKSPGIPAGYSRELLYRYATRGMIAMLTDVMRKNPEDQTAVTTLYQIVLTAASEENRILALDSLSATAKTGSRTAIDNLYKLGLLERQPKAMAVLREEPFVHPDPQFESAKSFFLKNKPLSLSFDPTMNHLTDFYLSVSHAIQHEMRILATSFLPNWGMIAGLLSNPADESPEINRILLNYSDFSNHEKALLIHRATNGNGMTRALIPRLYLRYEDSTLLEASLEFDLEPSIPEEKTVFHFLSNQWNKYMNEDLDYRVIKKSYQTASENLRLRLVQSGLKSGHAGWLESVTDNIQTNTAYTPTDFSQWEEWIDNLIKQQGWERLWQILPGAPLALIPEAIKTLQETGFVPGTPEEQRFYENLAQICRDFPGSLPVPFIRQFYSPTSKPFNLEGSAEYRYLAAAFLNDGIQIWNLTDSRIPPKSIHIEGINPKSICFSNNSETLATLWSDNSIRVFRFPFDNLINRIQVGKFPVFNFFLSQDNRRIFILEQSGKLTCFGYPEGTPIYETTLQTGSILRALSVSDKDILLVIDDHHTLTAFDMQHKQILSRLPDFPSVQVLASESAGDFLTCVTTDQQITVWNLLSGRQISAVQPQFFNGRITSACEISSGSISAFGSQNGECAILSLKLGKCLAEIRGSAPFGLVSAIRTSHDHSHLYLADFNSSVSEWDLTLLNLATSILKAENCPNPEELNAIYQRYHSESVRKLIQLANAVFDWRSRFDIEIEYEI